MKGVVLAGGLGTRMYPLTRVTNKHLLPVYDRPMVFYPIEKLVEAGIEDILVITGGNHAGEFLRLLGNGNEFGLKHLNYAYQEGEGGIAAALSLAEHFADGEPIVVILGDNLFQDSIAGAVRRFREEGGGALVVLKEVDDPERFGVPVLDGGRVVRIVEKPAVAPSRYAVTGVYLYDARVFEIIGTLEPSRRGELEITDVNNRYIEWGSLSYEVLEGWWTDAGTFESLYRASSLVRQHRLEQAAGAGSIESAGAAAGIAVPAKGGA
ncbi:MAG: NTP transferase domain-containing protein [Gemmatimonadetes bacterium]|nr:NTP transferase domain-containing protein [Gemmatimonadota bacterium]